MLDKVLIAMLTFFWLTLLFLLFVGGFGLLIKETKNVSERLYIAPRLGYLFVIITLGYGFYILYGLDIILPQSWRKFELF